MKIERVQLVVKRTSYTQLRATRRKGEEHVRRLVEDEDPSTDGLRLAHDEHAASVQIVKKELKQRGIEFKERVPGNRKKPAGRVDLVITVGGDGTLLDASHFVRGKTPVMGVNSAPTFSVGFLTACRGPTFSQTLDALIEDRIAPTTVHRLQVLIGKKKLGEPVLNDVLFAADNPALTSRYIVISPEGEEEQKSSGVWVATAAGSTAALRSAGGEPIPLDADRFAFLVREPYAPPGSEVRFASGVIERSQSLIIECRLSEASLYIDGSHMKYRVVFGDRISFRLHAEPLRLVRPAQGTAQLVRGY